MSERPDVHTQQKHRAALRRAFKKQPHNQTIHKALKKSLRAHFVQQAAEFGVFICYSMSDGIFALELALALRGAGIRAFLDELDADEGVDWGETVNQALRECAVLVLVLSPDGLADAEVKGEYAYFRLTGKIIVPVIAHPCDPSELDLLIEPINFAENPDTAMHALKSLLKSDHQASA